jgi:hypothetical protein
MPASAPVGVVELAFMSDDPVKRNNETNSCLRFICLGSELKTIQNPDKSSGTS